MEITIRSLYIFRKFKFAGNTDLTEKRSTMVMLIYKRFLIITVAP